MVELVRGSLAEQRTPVLVNLNAVNASRHVAVLAYLKGDSEPQTYATLQSGTSRLQQTFPGHRWRLSCAEASALSAEIIMPAEAAELRVDEPVPIELEQSLSQNLSSGIPGLGQLEMADVQAPLSTEAKGKIYAVLDGLNGSGLFDDWSTAGVRGPSVKTFEYSPRAPPSAGKLRSFGCARERALEWLLAHGSPAHRAAVQRVLDRDQAAAAEAARRDEAERAAEEQLAAQERMRHAEAQQEAEARASESQERAW